MCVCVGLSAWVYETGYSLLLIHNNEGSPSEATRPSRSLHAKWPQSCHCVLEDLISLFNAGAGGRSSWKSGTMWLSPVSHTPCDCLVHFTCHVTVLHVTVPVYFTHHVTIPVYFTRHVTVPFSMHNGTVRVMHYMTAPPKWPMIIWAEAKQLVAPVMGSRCGGVVPQPPAGSAVPGYVNEQLSVISIHELPPSISAPLLVSRQHFEQQPRRNMPQSHCSKRTNRHSVWQPADLGSVVSHTETHKFTNPHKYFYRLYPTPPKTLRFLSSQWKHIFWNVPEKAFWSLGAIKPNFCISSPRCVCAFCLGAKSEAVYPISW